MNLERGFHRITLVVSLAVLALACRLIAWPAVVHANYAFLGVNRPYRFVVQTEAGPYLVGSTRPMTDDQLRALFHQETLALDQDEQVFLLVVAATAHGHVIVGPRRPVWWGVSVFLLPYLVATVGLTFVPWGLFYLLRWVARGFRKEGQRP